MTDSAMYSIAADDWPDVRIALEPPPAVQNPRLVARRLLLYWDADEETKLREVIRLGEEQVALQLSPHTAPND